MSKKGQTSGKIRGAGHCHYLQLTASVQMTRNLTGGHALRQGRSHYSGTDMRLSRDPYVLNASLIDNQGWAAYVTDASEPNARGRLLQSMPLESSRPRTGIHTCTCSCATRPASSRRPYHLRSTRCLWDLMTTSSSDTDTHVYARL